MFLPKKVLVDPKLYLVITDKIGPVEASNIYDALVIAKRCRAMGIYADIIPNPNIRKGN